ncbi:cell wall-associated NlpC family hydrolase [Haloactinospora alba]|uniref:Cell wall-associated NlpC family hydrolase n=1 Tax=Haloactinospora alba TaxID=405555 RepID=A0A543NLE2_9ACTN|nr:C40 family peptidase [Haloactinospora alba]TQN32651.1 cell wall-associated NlpC family hydrolase [Haloactinospora alba]
MANLGCGAALLGAVLLAGVVFSALSAAVDLPQGADAPEEVDGIDDTLLDAYIRGAQYLDTDEGYDQCTGMRWSILAGIGAVESDHGASVTISPDGTTDPPFVGPRLDGSGVGGNETPHHDTDDGRWDGDTEYDRAVGVTQHLPASWSDYGVDATGSGKADPHNVYDSAASTAVELCKSAGGEAVDFSDHDSLADALYRYNPAEWYVDDVMSGIKGYDSMSADPSAKGGSEAGHVAVEWALEQLGKPYQWGGEGPDVYDCSGLTMKAWEAASVSIPRVTVDQFNHGIRVSLDELQPGDLLFFYRGPDPQPGHVTMYVGDGEMINAPSSGKVIRTDPIDMDYYASAFAGAVRPA